MNSNARVKALRGTVPTWSFADRLRKARRDYSEYTQEQMAEAIGVGLKAYSAWEAGRNNPESMPEVAVKLEGITGVTRTWFLGWVDDDNAPTHAKSAPAPKGEGGSITHLSDYKRADSRPVDTGRLAPVTAIFDGAA